MVDANDPNGDIGHVMISIIEDSSLSQHILLFVKQVK